jgi:hypothetical protein
VHRSVKPACLSCIGDVALAIGGKFEPYLAPVLQAIFALSDSIEKVPQVLASLLRPPTSNTNMFARCRRELPKR